MSDKPLTYEDALKAIKNPRHRAYVNHYLDTLNKTKAAELAGAKPENAAKEGWRMSMNVHVAHAIELGFAERAMGKNEVLARLGEMARASMEDFQTLEEIEYREKIHIPAFERREQLRARIADGCEKLEDEDLDEAARKGWKAVIDQAEEDEASLPSNPLELVAVDGPLRRAVVVKVDLIKAQRANKLHLVREVKQTDRGLEIKLHDAKDALKLIGEAQALFTTNVKHTGSVDIQTKPDVSGLSVDELRALAAIQAKLKGSS